MTKIAVRLFSGPWRRFNGLPLWSLKFTDRQHIPFNRKPSDVEWGTCSIMLTKNEKTGRVSVHMEEHSKGVLSAKAFRREVVIELSKDEAARLAKFIIEEVQTDAETANS